MGAEPPQGFNEDPASPISGEKSQAQTSDARYPEIPARGDAPSRGRVAGQRKGRREKGRARRRAQGGRSPLVAAPKNSCTPERIAACDSSLNGSESERVWNGVPNDFSHTVDQLGRFQCDFATAADPVDLRVQGGRGECLEMPGTPPKGPATPGTPLKGPARRETPLKGPATPGTPLKGPARRGTPLKGPATRGRP